MTLPRNNSPLSSLDALRALVRRERDNDPLIGVKLGSQVGLDLLVDQLRTERGVHAETLMAMAGRLIGQSVLASLWEEARENGHERIPGLRKVSCWDGTDYLVGAPLHQRLTEGLGSPWEVVGEAARQEGCLELPNREELLQEGLRRLGTPAFLIPQVPEPHLPLLRGGSEHDTPWPLLRPLCASCCAAPREWPLLCGLLAARGVRLVASHLDPGLAFQLVLDSAIDASKIPLAEMAQGSAAA
ncbi:MAG: hypothetical protein VKO44_04730 [Cyanobacteriota bacterium]|nr:hypothetical protein [Cyanobacteriota bacterium]